MMNNKFFLVLLIVVLISSDHAEARRKILKGRKTVTRTYFRDSIVPAWLLVLIVALVELFFGGMLYVLLKICVLDKAPDSIGYVPAASASV